MPSNQNTDPISLYLAAIRFLAIDGVNKVRVLNISMENVP
jgi:hypothetical protein